MKYMPIPVLAAGSSSSHQPVFYNNIIWKNFDTGIYRPMYLVGS